MMANIHSSSRSHHPPSSPLADAASKFTSVRNTATEKHEHAPFFDISSQNDLTSHSAPESSLNSDARSNHKPELPQRTGMIDSAFSADIMPNGELNSRPTSPPAEILEAINKPTNQADDIQGRSEATINTILTSLSLPRDVESIADFNTVTISKPDINNVGHPAHIESNYTQLPRSLGYTTSSDSVLSQQSTGYTELSMASARMTLSSKTSDMAVEITKPTTSVVSAYLISSRASRGAGSRKLPHHESEDEVFRYYRQNLTTPGSRLSWEQEEEMLRSQPSLSGLIVNENANYHDEDISSTVTDRFSRHLV